MATESQLLSPSSWFFIAPARLRLMQFMLIVPHLPARFRSRCFPFRVVAEPALTTVTFFTQFKRGRRCRMTKR